MWNLKYDTNDLIYEMEKRCTDIEKRPMVAKREGIEGAVDLEFGISRCKLVCIDWMNNKVLVYSIKTIFNILCYRLRKETYKSVVGWEKGESEM